MFVLTEAQTRRCLALLVTFHILVIAASNYLVQLPFTLWGFHTTWGAFSFPSSSWPPTSPCACSARSRLARSSCA